MNTAQDNPDDKHARDREHPHLIRLVESRPGCRGAYLWVFNNGRRPARKCWRDGRNTVN
jgi:hypothetical protein